MSIVHINKIIVGPFLTNCYIVYPKNSNYSVIIDPGADAQEIEHTLQELELIPRIVLLTHGHIDHVMALSDLMNNHDLIVYAHQAEKPVFATVPIQAEMFGLSQIPVPKISKWVNENNVIDVNGLSFKVIHTPGHTPGGCCYKLDKEIFVGDTLFYESIGRTDLPGGNYDQLINSIKFKLLGLTDDTVVYPGHGEISSIGQEKNINPFLRGEL